jgi:cytochrome o ubiquinol oxidase subunit III
MTRSPTLIGFWLYLMSDCVLFAALFAAYAVLNGETFGAAAMHVDLRFVFIETMLLLVSSATVGLALAASYARRRALALGCIAATVGLGAAFVSMEVWEFYRLLAEGNGPWANASLSSFFTLVGTHGLHVALGALWLVVVAVHIAARGLARTESKLLLAALFWHFLDVVWVCIFTFVYLYGALAL